MSGSVSNKADCEMNICQSTAQTPSKDGEEIKEDNIITHVICTGSGGGSVGKYIHVTHTD